MDCKNFDVKIKAAGPDEGLEEGQFTAYASVFGNVDSYGDVVLKGAFADSLGSWKDSGMNIPALWGHDTYDPFSNIGHLIEAKEDDRGLLVTAQLDLENPKAMQVYRLVKGKRINQMSFAYDVIDSAGAELDGQKVQELKKLRLYEVSVVPFGANSQTEILAVKAAADSLRSGSKAGRAISAKNEGELRKAYDSLGAVLSSLETIDQEKASGHSPANDIASVEEPSGANTPVKSEEPGVTPSATTLIAQVQLLGLTGPEGGSL